MIPLDFAGFCTDVAQEKEKQAKPLKGNQIIVLTRNRVGRIFEMAAQEPK
jgi:hypothetical protein